MCGCDFLGKAQLFKHEVVFPVACVMSKSVFVFTMLTWAKVRSYDGVLKAKSRACAGVDLPFSCSNSHHET